MTGPPSDSRSFRRLKAAIRPGSLSPDSPWFLRSGEAEQSSVAVARRDYIQPTDEAVAPDRLGPAVIFATTEHFNPLESDALEDVGGVDLVFDVSGGDIGNRSTDLIRTGGTLVTIAGPPEARPADGRAIDFVVVSDRAQLSEVVRLVRDGRLRTIIGNVSTLDDAVAAFNPTGRIKGKTIIRVRPSQSAV